MSAQDADCEMRKLLSFYSSARPNLKTRYNATEFTSETKGSKAVELPLPTRYVRRNRSKSKERQIELISQENSAESDFPCDKFDGQSAFKYGIYALNSDHRDHRKS
jgi:hypothetical protein